jgi:uncharacterized protein (TIGR02598 family)
MKCSSRKKTAFSLVELVLAIGVAAFGLIATLGMLPVATKTQQASVEQTKANAIISQIVGDLRADVRLPPGQASKVQGDYSNLHGHWRQVAIPDTLYFDNDTHEIQYGGSAPGNAVFKATITYMSPPDVTTSIAQIVVSWPASQSDLTKVSGSIEFFAAVNR